MKFFSSNKLFLHFHILVRLTTVVFYFWLVIIVRCFLWDLLAQKQRSEAYFYTTDTLLERTRGAIHHAESICLAQEDYAVNPCTSYSTDPTANSVPIISSLGVFLRCLTSQRPLAFYFDFYLTCNTRGEIILCNYNDYTSVDVRGPLDSLA